MPRPGGILFMAYGVIVLLCFENEKTRRDEAAGEKDYNVLKAQLTV
jgi:hypothetical protein